MEGQLIEEGKEDDQAFQKKKTIEKRNKFASYNLFWPSMVSAALFQ
jgi:hypothetical protein